MTELRTTTHGRVVRTVTLDGIDEELLGLLPASGGYAWVRDGAGFVGWGEAARFTISGPERFSRAQRWWSAWCEAAHVDDQVGVRGTGPVAFASFTFDSGPQESVVIVPAVVVGHRAGRTWLTTVELDGVAPVTPPDPDGPARPDRSAGSPEPGRWSTGRGPWPRRSDGSPPASWTRSCSRATSSPSCPRRSMPPRCWAGMAAAYPECWTFSVDGLVGATPELLVRRDGDRVTSRVLAGTVRRRGDDSVDAARAAALLDSDKDLEEHEYAVHSVAEALAAHCTDLDVPTAPHVLSLANVQHLATDVTGMLADGASALALAASPAPDGRGLRHAHGARGRPDP